MPVDKIKVEINKRAITLTNTHKVLYPQAPIIKAEFIEYMLSVADHILPLISGRPLTTIRWPDGINGKKFYSKNKPSWTPRWIKTFIVEGQEDNDYLLITDKASLAWVANLAALELHPMNMRISHPEHPDQMIFDLDPAEDFSFDDLKSLSMSLKDFLELEGYHPFIKTSGSKGLHIYLPIVPIYTYDQVVNQSKILANKFISEHPESTTLRISKVKRKRKVLIDIYRNHKHNSCVAPFSLRGKPGAPVSTPFPWEWMDKVESSQQWNLKNIQQFITEVGNSWANFDTYATALDGKPQKSKERAYIRKRDFKRTSEPRPEETIHTTGDQYVIQLHKASNLHYDLRLEHQGTLWSWAIPKGLPYKKGMKRMAIRTENHPLKYLTYEGTIPKGQYGGGEMWIFDSGRYSTIEWSEKKIKFKLTGGEVKGKFHLYNTKENQWLIEIKDEVELLSDKFTPMLAVSADTIPSSDKYFHEIKWDGIRAIFLIDDGKMKIRSRSGNDITEKFPEITAQVERIEAEQAVMDGEIVYLDENGKPDFGKVVGRIHHKSSASIKKSSISRPATAYLFDLISLDGRIIKKEPCIKRRAWLRAIMSPNERLRFSEAFQDGSALFTAITEQGMEGIISKLKSAPYRSGQRSEAWLKVKVRNEDQAYIVGWTAGKGDRTGLIGAFHLAKKENDHWKYMGKLGTGFDSDTLRKISSKIIATPSYKKLVTESIEEPNRTTWIEPYYIMDLEYASLSNNGTYREPVFKRIIHADTQVDILSTIKE